MEDDPNRIYRLDGVAHIGGSMHDEVTHRYISSMRRQHVVGLLPPPDCFDKFTIKCTWMQETFSHLLERADKETVRRYARAYMMMLLSTQLFGDKSGTRPHAYSVAAIHGDIRGHGRI
ncbi:hypothetical protein Ahy_B08g092918 [Arachis hypogaea]|uniref:Aminotransferase-like plant mobile domain-containing protein n=1 Tax=Arachis hypogaea TaxID=3818 RepID=A0A444Y4S5_ARAHY|nr:hypothetical protein Ahy_B08g092918 [Arachis hypogaea]